MKQFKKLTYKRTIQNISLFFALLISFWIPQYKFTLSLFIVLWAIFNIFQFNFINRFKNNFKDLNKTFFILQLFFFSLIVLGLFISTDKNEATDVIVKKLSFLIFPVLFMLSCKNISKNKYKFLKIFILGNIVAALICFSFAFYHSVSFENNQLIFNTIKDESNNFFTYTTFSVFHHPAYFSMYIVFSVAILFHLKKQSLFFNTKFKKTLFYITIIFFSITIFFLSSRAGMFSVFLLFIWKAFDFIKKNKSIYIKITFILMIVLSIAILSQNSRIIRTYNEITNLILKGKEYKNYPSRLFLWESAFEVIKENIIFGSGTGDANKAISEKAKKYKYRDNDITELNAHNQFLETFMSSGLIGIFVLLSIFFVSFYKAIKTRNELFIILLILFIFNFFFESMLNTIAGIVFFVYFLNYFMFVYNNETNEDI